MAGVNTLIREARNGDFAWVKNLMQNTLEAYYGGDHRAHAKRIFDAHIAGGIDRLGFFSFEQRMFIIEVGNEPAGIIHLVGKRQSTYKISPLIVAPKFQGQFGLGSRLLEHAEAYARNNNARQLYCTVAENNVTAMQFFLRKGFIKAGSSDSHYKSGVTETMLYKPLYEVSTIISLDQLHVSILPFDETNAEIKNQVSSLLLDKLQSSFEGITDDWVAALFDGYNRRYTLDINTKYKLIYIGVDNTGNVIAVEVISLQRLGWKLDALMPSAYHPGVITQQWSMNIGETTMRTMRVKKNSITNRTNVSHRTQTRATRCFPCSNKFILRTRKNSASWYWNS